MHIEPDYSHGALFGFSICSDNQNSQIMSTTKETTVTTTETVPQTIEIPVQQGSDIEREIKHEQNYDALSAASEQIQNATFPHGTPSEVVKETVTKE